MIRLHPCVININHGVTTDINTLDTEALSAYLESGDPRVDALTPSLYAPSKVDGVPWLTVHAMRILTTAFKTLCAAICTPIPELGMDKYKDKTAILQAVGIERGGYRYFVTNIEYIVTQLFKISKFKPRPGNKHAGYKAMFVMMGMIPGPGGIRYENTYTQEVLWMPPKSGIQYTPLPTGIIMGAETSPLVTAMLQAMRKTTTDEAGKAAMWACQVAYLDYWNSVAKDQFQGKLEGSGSGSRFWRGYVTTTRIPYSGRAILGALSDEFLPPSTVIVPWSMMIGILKIPVVLYLINTVGLTPKEADKTQFALINNPNAAGEQFKRWFINYVNYSKINYKPLREEYHNTPPGLAILLIRYPTLSMKSMYVVNAVLDENNLDARTIRINPIIATFFNGDYDGDECSMVILTKQLLAELDAFKVYRHVGHDVKPYSQSGGVLKDTARILTTRMLAEVDD